MADVIDRILKRLMAMAVFAVALFLISYVTLQVFGDSPPDVPGSTVTAYGTFAGTVAAGLWGIFKYLRKKRGNDVRP